MMLTYHNRVEYIRRPKKKREWDYIYKPFKNFDFHSIEDHDTNSLAEELLRGSDRIIINMIALMYEPSGTNLTKVGQLFLLNTGLDYIENMKTFRLDDLDVQKMAVERYLGTITHVDVSELIFEDLELNPIHSFIMKSDNDVAQLCKFIRKYKKAGKNMQKLFDIIEYNVVDIRPNQSENLSDIKWLNY